MPGNNLAGCVLLRFIIEVGVEHDSLALASRLLCRNVHLVAGHQKRSHSLWIISDDLLTYIVLVAAITIRISAKARDAHSAVEICLTICIGLDEFRSETVIATLSNRQVTDRQVTITNTLCQCVNEHAGTGSFQVVSFFTSFVD